MWFLFLLMVSGLWSLYRNHNWSHCRLGCMFLSASTFSVSNNFQTATRQQPIKLCLEQKMWMSIENVQLSLQWRQLRCWYNDHNLEAIKRNKLHLKQKMPAYKYTKGKILSMKFRYELGGDRFWGWIHGWKSSKINWTNDLWKRRSMARMSNSMGDGNGRCIYGEWVPRAILKHHLLTWMA